MSDKVEIRQTNISELTPWGPVERPHPFDAVLFNGKQVGWRPADPKDPNHSILHPLSGASQFLCDYIIDNCEDLKGTLTAPVPEPAEEEEDVEE